MFGGTARVAYSTAWCFFGTATITIFLATTFLAVFVIARFVGTIVNGMTGFATVITDHVAFPVPRDGLVLAIPGNLRVLGFALFLGHFGFCSWWHERASASCWFLLAVTGRGARRNDGRSRHGEERERGI